MATIIKDLVELGKLIKARKEALNLTNYSLEKLDSRFKGNTIRRIETGKDVHTGTLLAICELLGVRLEYSLEDKTEDVLKLKKTLKNNNKLKKADRSPLS